MDLSVKFRSYFPSQTNVGNIGKVIKKAPSLPFNLASLNIAQTISLVQRSVLEQKSSFIGYSDSNIIKESFMTDVEREIFLKQSTKEIESIDDIIGSLASKINKGKTKLAGDTLEHANGVFHFLDYLLSNCRNVLKDMMIQRNKILKRIAEASVVPADYIKHSPSNSDFSLVRPDESYQKLLLHEQEAYQDDLINLHDHLNQIENQIDSIGQMISTFGTLFKVQTEQIRIIQQQVEESATNFDLGNEEVKKSIDATQRKYLWMSLIIFFLAFTLIYKA